MDEAPITKDAVCWPSVERAVRARIALLGADLETADGDRVPRLQGEIAGLRWLLAVAEPPSAPSDSTWY